MREAGLTKGAAGGRWIFGGFLLGLVAHSWLWNQPWLPYIDSRAWSIITAEQYALRRRQEAFRGVPFDLIAARLSAIFPQEGAVALGPKMRSDPFLYQRAVEVFYPRRVSQTSVNTVEIDDGSDPSAVSLGTDARGRRYLLTGQHREGSPPASAPEEFTPHLLWFLLTVLACFDIGGVCSAAWTRIW